jgi:hypothetical protein
MKSNSPLVARVLGGGYLKGNVMTVSVRPAAIEKAEAETYADFEAAAPSAAFAALGTAQLRIGGGIALAMPNDPSGFWSKTLGLGFDQPVTAALLEQVFGFYREHGMTAATVQIAPQALPADWADICTKLNISATGSAWAKFAGDLGAVAERSQAAVRLDDRLRVRHQSPGSWFRQRVSVSPWRPGPRGARSRLSHSETSSSPAAGPKPIRSRWISASRTG